MHGPDRRRGRHRQVARPGRLVGPRRLPRFRRDPGIVEGVALLLEVWSTERPLALVIDDLHWADPATLAALARLHRLATTQVLVLVAAYRPVPRNPEMATLLTALRHDGALPWELGPLVPEAVTELVAATVGAEPGPELLKAARRAGGNPFLVTELVGALGRDGRIQIADGVADLAPHDAPRQVVQDLRDGIVDRMADLGPEGAHVLRVAAVLGPSFSVTDLSAVLGRSTSSLLPVVRAAVAAGLLRDDGRDLVFRHDLVREAVEMSLTPSTLAALHLEIGRTLAASGAPAVRVAIHFGLGAQPGDDAAVTSLRSAAAEIVSRSPTSAADLLERALELIAVTDPRRDSVIAELVDASFWGGQLERAAELAAAALRRPVAAAVATGLHETAARALVVLGRPAEAVAHAQASAGGASDDQAAWATALVAVCRLFALDLDGAVADAQRAEKVAALTGDPWAETMACSVQAWGENVRGFQTRTVALADRAVLAADRSPDGEAHRLIPHLFCGLALEGASRTEDRASHPHVGPAARRAPGNGVGHALLPLRIGASSLERRTVG